MTWREVDDVAAAGRPFALRGLLPPALVDVVLPCAWNLDALHALDLAVTSTPFSELAWQLDLPWWRVGARPFATSPNQVARDPAGHPGHWARTLAADVTRPLDLIERRAGWAILDGVHRLLRARIDGMATVPARRLDAEDLRRILVA